MDQNPSVNEATEIKEAPEVLDENAVVIDTGEDLIPELMMVSPPPHIHAEDNSRSVMLDVCIALLPALVWAVYIFGWRVLTITLLSMLTALWA